MPWKETCAMSEKHQLIDAWLTREFTNTELAMRFNVSRKTVVKWISRFKHEGYGGLLERSRAPECQANRTPANIEKQIVMLRHRYPNWGPVTLRELLVKEKPAVEWPAVSTFARILRRAGLTKRKRKRNHVPPHTQPLAHATASNRVWSADFKGQFKLGNSKVCYPLTIFDNYSRYLFVCKGLYGIKLSGVKPVYERMFREFGLPDAIRTDNGYPFAQVCLGGLTPLGIWLLKLGITPERIDAGHPEQNGRHERMHRTLKQATCVPPAGNLSAQQRAFNRFVKEYNQVRPHRSLDGKTPGEVYSSSSREYPETLPEVVYPDSYIKRWVKRSGHIRFFGSYVYISRQLKGEYVGLKQIGNERWQLFYSSLPLGVIDKRIGRVTRPTKV